MHWVQFDKKVVNFRIPFSPNALSLKSNLIIWLEGNEEQISSNTWSASSSFLPAIISDKSTCVKDFNCLIASAATRAASKPKLLVENFIPV